MKFDFAIGNPPYQEPSDTNGRQPPVYNIFMDEAYKVANCVELITPARFLFNAGQTPKSWNEKMLNDEHFKVLQYEADASKVFSNTDIKGGVTITLRNQEKVFGKIGEFITSNIMQKLVERMKPLLKDGIDKIHFNRSSYRLTDTLYLEHPELSGRVKPAERLSVSSNIFEKYPEIFTDNKPTDDSSNYARIFGLEGTKRSYKFIKSDYIAEHENLNKWKIYVAKSNGNGRFGETLSDIEIASPGCICTQTFISFGKFDSEEECKALIKYLKTKFARALLGVCKVTPDNARKEVWRFIPLQDFTSNSDINWNEPIDAINQKLYEKYNLFAEEIKFGSVRKEYCF